MVLLKYGSIPMLLLLLILACYFIKNKRFKRFEMTILISMFLKYALGAIEYIDATSKLIEKSETLIVISNALYWALSPIYHWIYAS